MLLSGFVLFSLAGLVFFGSMAISAFSSQIFMLDPINVLVWLVWFGLVSPWVNGYFRNFKSDFAAVKSKVCLISKLIKTS